MAQNQKLSIRAYSFSLRKWRSKRPNHVYMLNSELRFPYQSESGELQEYVYLDAFELFKDFISENEEAGDKEYSQQLFRCQLNTEGETESYRYLIFSVFSGYYGYASELINRNTKRVVHKKTRDEADVKQFYVTIIIPFDTEIVKTRRGLIFFQEIGIFGVKTVTSNSLQDFFSKKLMITFKLQNLAPDFYLKKLFETGILQKIKVARNSVSADASDRLYGAGFGREERILIPFKITKKLKDQLKHVSEGKYNFFTFDGQEYLDVKMIVKIGDRIRTINLHALEDLSVEEILPQELLRADGIIAFDEFVEHIMTVATEYLDHLPVDF
jgi:hypothetical protein